MHKGRHETSRRRLWPLGLAVMMMVGMVPLTAGAVTCTPTGFVRDGINLTAALINPGNVTNTTVDADGCDIGIYYDSTGSGGTISGSNIHGAKYFGVLNFGADVTIEGSSVHNIGESPFNGAQHGVAIYFIGGGTGIISGNEVYQYQKGGIVVNGSGSSATVINNTVTGLGRVDFIAQNGIQFSKSEVVELRGNVVTGNLYTQGASKGWVSTGMLLLGATFSEGDMTIGDIETSNTIRHNQVSVFKF